MTTALWLIVLSGALSIVYGIVTTRSLMAADAGTARMQEISAAVREGAKAYLNRQYTTIAIVGVVIFVIAWLLLGQWSAIGFAIGAILSGLAGFIGMNVSVRANVRVAQAATKSLAGGLDLAFVLALRHDADQGLGAGLPHHQPAAGAQPGLDRADLLLHRVGLQRLDLAGEADVLEQLRRRLEDA